jgi:hypothetical protein
LSDDNVVPQVSIGLGSGLVYSATNAAPVFSQYKTLAEVERAS